MKPASPSTRLPSTPDYDPPCRRAALLVCVEASVHFSRFQSLQTLPLFDNVRVSGDHFRVPGDQTRHNCSFNYPMLVKTPRYETGTMSDPCTPGYDPSGRSAALPDEHKRTSVEQDRPCVRSIPCLPPPISFFYPPQYPPATPPNIPCLSLTISHKQPHGIAPWDPHTPTPVATPTLLFRPVEALPGSQTREPLHSSSIHARL